MRAEISALFHLQLANTTVKNAHIGSGVHLQELDPDWLDEVKAQCPKVEAREQIEWLQPYTHRFFYEVDAREAESPLEVLLTGGVVFALQG